MDFPDSGRFPPQYVHYEIDLILIDMQTSSVIVAFLLDKSTVSSSQTIDREKSTPLGLLSYFLGPVVKSGGLMSPTMSRKALVIVPQALSAVVAPVHKVINVSILPKIRKIDRLQHLSPKSILSSIVNRFLRNS